MSFLPFRQQPPAPALPGGFELRNDYIPSAEAINQLLAACNEAIPPADRWAAALQNSYGQLCILDCESGELVGFVRITSDQALNANLWNLAARPGPHQAVLLAVLVHRSLSSLRKELPGQHLDCRSPSSTGSAEESRFVLTPVASEPWVKV